MLCETRLMTARTSRKPVRRRAVRRDALVNREKILTVAAELMGRRGRNVALADIAEAAGVGIGTLYRGYPDRTALLHARSALVIACAAARCAPPDRRRHYGGRQPTGA